MEKQLQQQQQQQNKQNKPENIANRGLTWEDEALKLNKTISRYFLKYSSRTVKSTVF